MFPAVDRARTRTELSAVTGSVTEDMEPSPLTSAPATTDGLPAAQVLAAQRATYVAFIGSGFGFASWASRIPQVRDALEASPSTLGLVLLGVSLTVFAGPLFGVADQAAQEMLDRTSYIQAVLGEDAAVPPLALKAGGGK